MSKLPRMMNLASKDLQLSLERARDAIEHNLSTGQALEEAVRVFLRKHLHSGLGITQGQVIDTAGNVTKQLDVIVYDAQSTPMLFTSEDEGHQLVPVEGVVGVVEVKATISASSLPAIIANMQSVKSMTKSAYHQPTRQALITNTYTMFGDELEHFPIVYSLFAFESSEMENLVRAFRKLNDVLPPSQRIDNTCLLDRGLIANLTVEQRLDAVPNMSTKSCALTTEHALVGWYVMIQRLYSQAKSEPINMQSYLGNDFYF